MAESLIQSARAAEAAAPTLSFFSEIEESANKQLAADGEFTGERLFRDRPKVYAAVVRMAAEGQSISATARALSVSRNTVCAVREREGITIEQDKKELLKDLRRAQRLGVEKVIELIPSVTSAKDAAIVSAVMIDKHELLSGGATSRVERVEVRPDAVREYLDSLPVVDAEVVEITGVQGEKDGAKGDAGNGVRLGSGDDIKSSDFGKGNSVRADEGATCGAGVRSVVGDGGCVPEGGGGGACDLPPLPYGDGSEGTEFLGKGE